MANILCKRGKSFGGIGARKDQGSLIVEWAEASIEVVAIGID